MDEIKRKIQELLKVSAENFDHLLGVKGGGWSEKFDDKMKRQETLMDELKVLAIANKTFLGRTYRFPMADSYALYLITKINTKTVQLTWLDYCDAWQDDRIGYRGNLSTSYVKRQFDFDDLWAEAAKKQKVMQLSAPGMVKTTPNKECDVQAE